MTTLTPPNSPSPRAPTVSSSTVSSSKQKNHYEDACVESQKPSLVKEGDCELEAESDVCSSATFWEVACTVYLPLALLWIRGTISFASQFIRALVFGHLIRFLLSYVTPWESNPAWLRMLAGPAGKVDSQSWPPPTLIALGALTIFFLLIHPDGTTWIILRKLRDAMLSLLGSSRSCWNFVLQDYGILPTIAAACTFLVLFGLIWIVHRTLTPKTPPSKKLTTASTPEKHKKKKRKGTHRSGRGGRASNNNTPHRSHRSTTKPIPEDNATDYSSQVVPNDGTCPETIGETKLEASDDSHLDKTPDIIGSNRLRTESRDTVTTDDQSYESTSVRSYASAPTPVTTSLHSKGYQHADGKPASRGGSVYRRRDSGKLSKLDRGEKAKDSRESFTRPRVILSSSTTPSPSGRFAALASKRSDSRRPMNLRATAGQYSNGKPFSTTDSPSSTSASSFFSSVPEMRTPGYSGGRGSVQSDRQVASPSLLSDGPAVPFNTPTNESTPHRTFGLPPGFERSARRDKVQSLTPRGSQNKGKMELAALLSQVGLGGNAREDLLEAVDDVDALAKLSDVQFELYNVTPAQKAQIELLLNLRRHSTASPLGSPMPARSNTSPLPPPPGLELPSCAPTTEISRLTSPPRTTGLASLALPSLQSTTGSSARQLLGTQYEPVSRESWSQHPFDEVRGESNNDEDDSSRIEAELQELGGQMVGSVLDF